MEKRATVVAQMRALAAETGELSDEQRSRFEALKAEADALQARLDRAAVVEDMERRMQGQPIAGTGDARLDAEVRGFSLVRAIASAAGLAVDAGREREISAEIARRAGRPFQGIAVPMAVFQVPVEQRVITSALPAGGAGGNLISTDLRGDLFIDLLRKALVVRGLGARVLTGLVGNLDIPRQKAATTAGWVAENTALTAADAQFDKVSLTPKHAGCLTELSRNVLMQTSPDIEALVRADFAAVLAETLDVAAIAGTGTGNQPTGILNVSGIGAVAAGTNGGALTYDLVADLVGSVADVNAEQGSLAFLTNTKQRRAAAKLKDGQSRPLGLDTVFQGMPRAFSNVVPSNLTKGTGTNLSAMLYGNWSDLMLGLWSELDILVNPFASGVYEKGSVQVRAMMSVDIAVRHPESFGAIKDLT